MNKKLFEDLILGTPTNSDRIAFGKAGDVYKNITVGDFKTILQAGILPTHKTITAEIGAWNMDLTLSKSAFFFLPPVPPAIISLEPIPLNKIRSVSVIIRNDADNAYSDFLSVRNGTILTTPQIQIATFSSIFTSTIITLSRQTGSFYDSASYSKTQNPDTSAYNRGWVTITYVD